MKRGKRKIRECVYCGEVKAVAKEHVVPKCLFIKPYPPNLISVPACDDCNNAKSLDDDFLRDFLVCDNFVSQSPVAQQIFQQKMLSSQRKGSSLIAREAILKGRLESLYTKGGIYIGDFHSFSVNEQRLNKIFETLVRGLYYDAHKKRFPDGYQIELTRHFPWEFKDVFTELSKLHLNKRVLGNVFGCAFTTAQEDPFTTAWIFWFYERIMFSVFTSHPAYENSSDL